MRSLWLKAPSHTRSLCFACGLFLPGPKSQHRFMKNSNVLKIYLYIKTLQTSGLCVSFLEPSVGDFKAHEWLSQKLVKRHKWSQKERLHGDTLATWTETSKLIKLLCSCIISERIWVLWACSFFILTSQKPTVYGWFHFKCSSRLLLVNEEWLWWR